MSGQPETADIREMLARVPFFVGLDEALLEAVARDAVRREYRANEMLFLEGDACPGLCILSEGQVKVVRMSAQGREQVVQVLGPGEPFHAVGALLDAPCPGTLIALESAVVWIIASGSLQRLLAQEPEFSLHVIRALAGRVLTLLDLVEDLSLRSVEARLARLLLEQAEQDVLARDRWMTQAQLAARLGTVLDVLNRALRRLTDEGLIEVDRHEIRILDREALEARAVSDR